MSNDRVSAGVYGAFMALAALVMAYFSLWSLGETVEFTSVGKADALLETLYGVFIQMSPTLFVFIVPRLNGALRVGAALSAIAFTLVDIGTNLMQWATEALGSGAPGILLSRMLDFSTDAWIRVWVYVALCVVVAFFEEGVLFSLSRALENFAIAFNWEKRAFGQRDGGLLSYPVSLAILAASGLFATAFMLYSILWSLGQTWQFVRLGPDDYSITSYMLALGVQVGPTVLFVAAYLLRNTQDEDRKRLVVGLVIFAIAIQALDVYTNVGMWLRDNYNGDLRAMLVALASFSDKSALTLIWLALCFGVSWFEELIAAMANQTYEWFALAYYGFTGKKLSTKKQQQRQQQPQRQDEPPQQRPQRPQPDDQRDIPPDLRAIFSRIDQG